MHKGYDRLPRNLHRETSFIAEVILRKFFKRMKSSWSKNKPVVISIDDITVSSDVQKIIELHIRLTTYGIKSIVFWHYISIAYVTSGVLTSLILDNIDKMMLVAMESIKLYYEPDYNIQVYETEEGWKLANEPL